MAVKLGSADRNAVVLAEPSGADVVAEREQNNYEMRNTPGPGTYEIPDFVTEWQKKPHAFRSSFKNQGRESPIYFTANRDGRYLAPGLYEHKDFVSSLLKNKYGPTYGAKSRGRDSRPTSPPRRAVTAPSADVNLGPGVYNVEKYQAIGYIPRNAPPMSMFRSQTPRFHQRTPSWAKNPGPANYSLPVMLNKSAVSSSFTSRTARFKSPANKVPGPGTYDRCINTPAAAESLTKIGKLYGLFFPVDYYP